LHYNSFAIIRNEDATFQRLLTDLYSVAQEFFTQSATFKGRFATNVNDNGTVPLKFYD